METDVICLDCGSAAVDGLGFQQDDGQIQILTVGHNSTEEGGPEPVMSCTHSQSKQDLRVTMLKKGTVGAAVTSAVAWPPARLHTHNILLQLCSVL